MRKFVFRLETLLQHRIHLEEKERNKFSLMRAELLAELNHKDLLQTQQRNTLSELMFKKSGVYDAQEISWFYLFLHRLEQEIQRSNERAGQLEKNLETQKQIMIGASRNKQMIENLKKKRQKEYCVALDREDQKSIDEIVVTRFARRP
jgi:flagellar FliJ protein